MVAQYVDLSSVLPALADEEPSEAGDAGDGDVGSNRGGGRDNGGRDGGGGFGGAQRSQRSWTERTCLAQVLAVYKIDRRKNKPAIR